MTHHLKQAITNGPISNFAVATSPLDEDEAFILNHISMFGSAGYPVHKCGSRHWTWDMRGKSTPRVYPTKKEAVKSFEAYLDILRDKKAGRV